MHKNGVLEAQWRNIWSLPCMQIKFWFLSPMPISGRQTEIGEENEKKTSQKCLRRTVQGNNVSDENMLYARYSNFSPNYISKVLDSSPHILGSNPGKQQVANHSVRWPHDQPQTRTQPKRSCSNISKEELKTSSLKDPVPQQPHLPSEVQLDRGPA